jgi:adenosine deaminase
VRYLCQTSRIIPAHELFAEFVAAYELATRDKRVVGMNLVAPEENPVSLRDYELQMSMLDFLHRKYDGRSPLRVALHAGELTSAVVGPDHQHDLTFHIRRAVEVGHAERIGHGVDVLSEDDSASLRAELHDKNVLVEICLTSNADTLDVTGKHHPLSAYIASGVPVTIATDDPGVARSSMTKEYLRAATDQGLGYLQLKRMARDSIEHAFLPGQSLWRSVVDASPADACAGASLGLETASDACRELLSQSERARTQWELERRFADFERSR